MRLFALVLMLAITPKVNEDGWVTIADGKSEVDVVLIKYSGDFVSKDELVKKFHPCRVVQYPDSQIPILISKRDLEKVKRVVYVIPLSPTIE